MSHGSEYDDRRPLSLSCPQVANYLRGSSRVVYMPTELERPLKGPVGSWKGVVNVYIEFITDFNAASHPGQSEPGGGVTYMCLGSSILFPGGVDVVCCMCPTSYGPSYLRKAMSRGEKDRLNVDELCDATTTSWVNTEPESVVEN